MRRTAFLREFLLWFRTFFLRKVRGLDIHPTVRMSLSAKIDQSFRAGIHIGKDSYIAFNARVMAYDFAPRLYQYTHWRKLFY